MMRRRVYSGRRSSYPAYQRPRRVRRRLRVPASLRIYAAAGLLSLGAWWGVNATALQVKDITIRGAPQVSREQILAVINAQLDQRRLGVLPQRNLVWFDVDAAVGALRKQFSLEAVAIQRHWPGRLEVEIREPSAALVWVTANQSYEVDRTGMALHPVSTREATQQQGSLRLLRPRAAAEGAPIIYDLANVPVSVEQPVVGESQVSFFQSLASQLNAVLDAPVAHFRYQQAEHRVEAVTQGGWRIIVDAQRPIGEQVRSLETVLRQTIKNQSSLDYVDIRFGGKVFYR